MTILSVQRPGLIHPHRHADNALYPEVGFYARVVGAQNHAIAYCRKPVYGRTWPLSTAGGPSGVVARWYCKTGYGAKRLVVFPTLGLDDHAAATDPYVSIAITKVGGATTTLDFHGGAAIATVDGPEEWMPQIQTCDVDAASEYTAAVTFNDNVRLLDLEVWEDYIPTVDEDTTYFSEWEPAAGSPVYDNRQQRLLQGLGAMVRLNRGLRADWSLDDGSSRTRSSATLINLQDNSTTGTPAASSPGVTFVTSYRNTVNATVAPIKMAVYGSIGGGSGTVKLRDTSGNDAATVTINGAAGWYTNTGSLTIGTGQKYDLLYAGDGANTVSVSAVSVYEIQ